MKLRLQKQSLLLLLIAGLSLTSASTFAQGTWTPVTLKCPGTSGGVMLVLSDGTIMCKTFSGGSDGYGNLWYRLKPDASGSYVNGTWLTVAPMQKTRLYFSSQVLKDGRVYCAGGEYGTGGSSGETYNPLTDIWTPAPSPGSFLSDANSEILEDGIVLQAAVTGTLKPTKYYDPVANTYSTGPNCVGIHNESSWVKLPDNSILFIDRNATTSERYIPALGQWMADANVPVSLYDPFGLETGAALLLPDGRAFYIGSAGHTAYYTPSGNTNPGSWAAGPDLPNAQGQPDAPAAMMVNGKILLTCSPVPTSFNHFPTPTSFYEFDYLTNTYTRLNAPEGTLTSNVSCYVTNMVDLPNGEVLFSYQGNNQYYVYTPSGAAIAAGKPVISKIAKAGAGKFRITGSLFNGISEGASYGDDWQMASNYPLVRITANGAVYYARTFNWNSTGVRRIGKSDTAFFTAPAGLPKNTSYAVVVVANGISSNAFVVPGAATAAAALAASTATSNDITATTITGGSKIYPNPAKTQATLQFSLASASHVSIKITDMSGKQVALVLNSNLQQGTHTASINTSSFAAGTYFVTIVTGTGTQNLRLIVN